MPERPILVFDVNETLLNLDALGPAFDRIFNDPAAMRLWFANLVTYSDALTLNGIYIPFTDIGHSFSDLWPVEKQWTVVGFYKGAHGKLSGAEIGASLRGLPVANISGWFSGEATVEQMRGIATHAGPAPTEIGEPAPDASIETVQRQLNACGFTVTIDGDLGSQTRKALRFFQIGWCGEHDLQGADGQLTPETRNALAWAASRHGVLGPKARNFHYQEFRLDNRGDPRVRRRIGLAAQAYRDKFGPTQILSSARSVEHNHEIGGASDSRHLFPEHWDAIDPWPQVHSVSDVRALGVWTGIGQHAAAPQSVDHLDLRPGSASNPAVFPDHYPRDFAADWPAGLISLARSLDGCTG
jgi:Putative peptidoglycan binding domain/Peptidase M15